MRIAEYKQIDTEVVSQTALFDDYDDDGNVIGQHEAVIEIEKPIMGMVYRDATEEEISQMESAEPIEIEPTAEERIEALESALLELIIGGGM